MSWCAWGNLLRTDENKLFTKTNSAPGGRATALILRITMRRNDLSLKCFSPPIMIATFIIELAGMLFVLWRYRQTTASKLIAALLGLLALFQLAEYNVCEGALGLNSVQWAQIGFASISLLPALGFHLVVNIAGRTNKFGVRVGYMIAATFAAFFLLVASGVQSSVCGGNYILFRLMPAIDIYYMAYYYGWILLTMLYAYVATKEMKDKKRLSTLRYLIIGYAAFIVPTTIVNIIDPRTIAGIPSVMCGFAVFLALILIFIVTPRVCVPRKTKSSLTAKRKNKRKK